MRIKFFRTGWGRAAGALVLALFGLSGGLWLWRARPAADRAWLQPLAAVPAPENFPAAVLARALRLNLSCLDKLPPEKKLRILGRRELAVGRLRAAQRELLAFLEGVPPPGAKALSRYLQAHFSAFEVALSRPAFPWFGRQSRPVFYTGYYVPTLNGSLTPNERYHYPLYRRPDDLVTVELSRFRLEKAVRRLWPWLEKLPLIPGLKALSFPRLRGRLTPDRRVVPYYTREEIDYQGKLAGRGLELLWVDDDSDRFFLQIQGSGRVRLPDGTILMVGYAAANGHPYRSIGAQLISWGELSPEEVSMPVIRHWLAIHPGRRRELLITNPSYVFFRRLPTAEPLGCLGLPLTPRVSVAADRRVYPGGLLALAEFELPRFTPAGDPAGYRLCRRLVLVQDTGGAIRGPGRIDLYCGADREAELVAGWLKARGRLILLWPKTAVGD